MTRSTRTHSDGADARKQLGIGARAAHPYGFPWRKGLPPFVGACIVMGAMGITTSAHAASPSFGSQNAAVIIAQSRAAMASAGSVNASGKGSGKIPGLGKITIIEINYSAATSGSQVLKTVAARKNAGIALPSATTLDVGGQLYVRANSLFWSSFSALTETEAVQAANKWVQIQPSSSLYAIAAADLTMPSLLTDLFSSDNFHKGNVRTIDGVRAIAITYTNTGEDPGHATAYVALGGKHLPVSVSIGGESVRFTSWGQTKAITAPANPVQLTSLLPPSEATN